jgi:hypothetical protein
MATITERRRSVVNQTTGTATSFDRFAGGLAIAVGAGGLLYAITFVSVVRGAGTSVQTLNALFLGVSGLAATPVLVALFDRLRAVSYPFALWALILGIAGSIGSSVHGFYDLAVLTSPPDVGGASLAANPVDPRGVLTFGFAGIGLAVFSWLILQSARLPRGLGRLGFLSAALLGLLYLGRLLLYDPANPVLLALAAISGFIVGPLWYVWLGVNLRRAPSMGPSEP